MFGTIDFFDDMVKLRKAMDGIFREVNTGYEYPAVDMKDSGEKIRLRALLPGVTAEDLSIELVDNSLVIRGERKSDVADRPYIKRERSFGAFKKAVKLPYAVDREKIHASMSDGVLVIELEKSEEARPRRIEIK
jgi:HSP20 family protein